MIEEIKSACDAILCVGEIDLRQSHYAGLLVASIVVGYSLLLEYLKEFTIFPILFSVPVLPAYTYTRLEFHKIGVVLIGTLIVIALLDRTYGTAVLITPFIWVVGESNMTIGVNELIAVMYHFGVPAVLEYPLPLRKIGSRVGGWLVFGVLLVAISIGIRAKKIDMDIIDVETLKECLDRYLYFSILLVVALHAVTAGGLAYNQGFSAPQMPTDVDIVIEDYNGSAVTIIHGGGQPVIARNIYIYI
jgi:hypothetical protein